jgi:hypothetical protein
MYLNYLYLSSTDKLYSFISPLKNYLTDSPREVKLHKILKLFVNLLINYCF